MDHEYRPGQLHQHVPQWTTTAATGRTPLPTRLTGEALRLLVKLDTKVRLEQLCARFPRVLNRIAQVWDRPEQADRYFD